MTLFILAGFGSDVTSSIKENIFLEDNVIFSWEILAYSAIAV